LIFPDGEDGKKIKGTSTMKLNKKFGLNKDISKSNQKRKVRKISHRSKNGKSKKIDESLDESPIVAMGSGADQVINDSTMLNDDEGIATGPSGTDVGFSQS
jgi:hypothetical protein